MDAPVTYPCNYKAAGGNKVILLVEFDGGYVGVWQGHPASDPKGIKWFASRWSKDGKNEFTENLNIG